MTQSHMENQRQPSGSYFGPKLRMSTRSKAANGSRRRGPRFKSKRMNNIAKEMERRKTYMLLNMGQMNARGVSVKDDAHMHNGKKPCGSDKKDQDGINISPDVNKLPQKDSRAGQPSDVLPLTKNGASKSKQSLSHISKNARQSPTSSLDNDLIPFMDIKSSDQARVKNVLPSIRSKELENLTPFHTKDGSNAMEDGSTTKLGLRKQSHSRTSHHVDVEFMAKSAHQARNVDLELIAKLTHQARKYNGDDDTLGPKSNGCLNRAQGQESNVRKDAKEISRGSNIPFASETPKVSCEDKNCAIVSSKDVAQSEFTKTCLHKKDQPSRYVGKNNDVDSKRKKAEGKLTTCDNDDCTSVVRQDNLTCGTIKKRRCIPSNEDGDEVGGRNKNMTGVDSTIRLTQQEALLKKQQCNYCSKPICEPSWKGIFKIDGKEYISLAGHLSTKSCEKVWELSKSLPPVVEVERVSRLVAWPSVWKASKPSSDNIGLYFLPENTRNDEELDQLVKEIMDKDLVLRAVIDEAEMLIFPSVLLPERHQTFRTKHYLWAAFKAKEGKGTASVEQEDKEKHVSSQLDEVQSEESDQEMILMKCVKPLENLQLPAKSVQEVETCCVQGPTNMHLGREAVCTSASTAVATDSTTVANAATVPSEATSFATNTASFPANHGAIDPSMEARPCSSSVFGIFVRETPKVQKLIKEFERDGELIAVMQGDAVGVGQWASNITTAMQ